MMRKSLSELNNVGLMNNMHVYEVLKHANVRIPKNEIGRVV